MIGGQNVERKSRGRGPRSPQERRDYEAAQALKRQKNHERKLKDIERDKEKRNFGVNDTPEVRVLCQGDGYMQLDVGVFENRSAEKGRICGYPRVNLCPTCSAKWLDKGINLRYVGPVVEEQETGCNEIEDMRQRSAGSRVRLF